MSRMGTGVGRGNWGGRRPGQPVIYLTEFDDMFRLMKTMKSHLYEPTIRGVCKALGLDRDTFQRYRTGEYKLPSVVKAHMWALMGEEPPPPFYWDYVKLFRIKPVFRIMEDTERRENVLEVEFQRSIFHVRPFWMNVNRKFREVIFQFTHELTPVLHRDDWEPILETALGGGYSGRYATRTEQEYKSHVLRWCECLIPWTSRKSPTPYFNPPSPWYQLHDGSLMHRH